MSLCNLHKGRDWPAKELPKNCLITADLGELGMLNNNWTTAVNFDFGWDGCTTSNTDWLKNVQLFAVWIVTGLLFLASDESVYFNWEP